MSTALSEIINRHRPGSSIALDGSLPPMDPTRQEMLRRFKDGDVQFLCNCGIATEGFDAPNVEFSAEIDQIAENGWKRPQPSSG